MAEQFTLNGCPVSKEDLQRQTEKAMQEGKRIVEVSPGNFRVLSRLNG